MRNNDDFFTELYIFLVSLS